MTRVELATSQQAFEGAHRALDRARRGTARIPLDRAVVAALLHDHSRMVARLVEIGERPVTQGE